jgi:SAM-dependent methyltransferase
MNRAKHIPQPMLPRGFLGRIVGLLMPLGHKTIYEPVSKELNLQREDNLLEVACGSGYFLKYYAGHVRSIAGLDLSELMVKMATKRNRDRVAAGTAEFVRGEASQLPWEDNKFSVATVMGSFMGFPRPLETLKEICRVLRPAGRMVVSIEYHAEDGSDHTKQVERWGMGCWTEAEVRAMMGEAGFSETTVTYAKGMGIARMMIVHGAKQAIGT